MRRWLLRTAALSLLITVLVPAMLAGHKKKEEEPKPQVLPLPKELPRAIVADTDSLTFQVTPLLRAGHLSSQIRETLSGLIRDTRGATVVKLRAFVAGAGDSRRVQEMVGAMFTDKKLPLPVLTIVQVGALGGDSAAVVMEAVVSEHKPVNPNGLAFFAGQTGSSLEDALNQLDQSVTSAGLAAGDVVSATCFVPGVTGNMQSTLATRFSQAAVNTVQALRDPVDSRTTCEAVARLPKAADSNRQKNDSRVSYATGQQVIFTGLQLSFGTYLADADSALERLAHDVAAVHTNIKNAVSVNAFSLNPAAVSALQKTMAKFNLPSNTLTVQPVESLPSLDAALGVEAVLTPGEIPETSRSQSPGTFAGRTR